MSSNRGLLTLGVLLVVIVVSVILYEPLHLIDWTLIPALFLALCGCWVIVLGALKATSPKEYEISAFSTFAWGILFTSVGGALFLWAFSWVYSFALILLSLAALALFAAFKGK